MGRPKTAGGEAVGSPFNVPGRYGGFQSQLRLQDGYDMAIL
jgi:hypothetical protein